MPSLVLTWRNLRSRHEGIIGGGPNLAAVMFVYGETPAVPSRCGRVARMRPGHTTVRPADTARVLRRIRPRCGQMPFHAGRRVPNLDAGRAELVAHPVGRGEITLIAGTPAQLEQTIDERAD